MAVDNFASERRKLILRKLTLFPYSPFTLLYRHCFGGRDLQGAVTRRTAQRVLADMAKKQELNRFKPHSHSEYIYHIGPRLQSWQSHLALARLYLNIEEKGRGRVLRYQWELEFTGGRCDAFIVAEYQGIRKKFFVEIDRGTSPFKKAAIYNGVIQSPWQSQSWADPLGTGNISFPIVAVFTIRKGAVERDLMKAKFHHYIFDLYDYKTEVLFHGEPQKPGSGSSGSINFRLQ